MFNIRVTLFSSHYMFRSIKIAIILISVYNCCADDPLSVPLLHESQQHAEIKCWLIRARIANYYDSDGLWSSVCYCAGGIWTFPKFETEVQSSGFGAGGACCSYEKLH
jgi:hypothetical protein